MDPYESQANDEMMCMLNSMMKAAMTNDPTNPPAFPTVAQNHRPTTPDMSLWHYFAGCALQSLDLSQGTCELAVDYLKPKLEKAAHASCLLADAMMAEHRKRFQGDPL